MAICSNVTVYEADSLGTVLYCNNYLEGEAEENLSGTRKGERKIACSFYLAQGSDVLVNFNSWRHTRTVANEPKENKPRTDTTGAMSGQQGLLLLNSYQEA